jgi:hypothetical protein
MRAGHLLLASFLTTVVNATPYDDAVKEWNSYVSDFEGQPIQKPCLPVRIPFRGDYKGMAMLVHGFSACPNQVGLAVLIPALSTNYSS